MSNILVIAPHPDDETLGCGGTLLKHRNQGDGIYWLLITNIHREYGWSEDAIQIRQKEIDRVADMYQFNKLFKLDYPTAHLDKISLNELVASVSKIILAVKPETIYIPFENDIHTDHQICFKVASSSTKGFRYPFIRNIFGYETLSETEFTLSPGKTFAPNYFVDITEFFPDKLDIFSVYKSENMQPQQPRSKRAIEALAIYRGCRINVNYAEAFFSYLQIT